MQNDSFVKDGEMIVLRSAEIHYSRVPRAYWRDRLSRLQAMGMNAIATYVPWNLHEEIEGTFNFDGERDILHFLETAQDLGLMVLLRAGPYMCGEWEFGGFPAWILNKNVTIRTYEPNYISFVDKYWGTLLDHVKPMLYINGGPVVMLQVENEYGSYGDTSNNANDKAYMEHLIDIANEHLGKGAVVLYTTDGGNADFMRRGSIRGNSVLTLGDGGWACAAQATFNAAGTNPCMNSEDYTGWLTHWGEAMANTSAKGDDEASHAAKGQSFNLYMGHGGSNFGFWSGANGGGKGYQPHITSYDYSSPVSENGDHGHDPGGHDKFKTMLDAMAPFAPAGGFPAEPAPLPRKAYGEVRLTGRAALLSQLATLAPSGAVHISAPTNMESLGQNYGLIYYETSVTHGGSILEIQDYPRDRAQVFVNGSYNGAIYRPEAAPLGLSTPAAVGSTLGLLVENMGRLNYGPDMADPKGINTPVTLDGAAVASAWKAYSIPLRYAEVSGLSWSDVWNCSEIVGPVFYKGALEVSGVPEDTWLRVDGWTKGIMWVNGFNLGRYWLQKGPQQAFYTPAPYLKTGSNEVVVLEMDQGDTGCTVKFDDRPDFSGNPLTACKGTPQVGDVLHMRECDASLSEHMAWELRNVSTSADRWAAGRKHDSVKNVLALGVLCLGYGPAKDPQSGQPAATLVECASAVQFEVRGSTLAEDHNACLDVTSHGQTPGERVEWYACQPASYAGKNQLFDFVETPGHLQQVVSRMDGRCLSACPVFSSRVAGSVFV